MIVGSELLIFITIVILLRPFILITLIILFKSCTWI